MELFEVIDPRCCSVTLKSRDKQGLLRELARLALQSPRLEGITEDELVAHLAAREADGSTAYGDGVAIPHARIEGLSDFIVVIGVAPRGVSFDALDGKKVRIFTTILGPAERPQEYLKLLASISRLLVNSRLRRELLRARSPESVREACVRWSRAGVPSGSGGDASQGESLLTVVLYEQGFLYPLLEFFVESGIEGATILDSHGMNEYISQVPLYAEMIQFMSSRKSRSKTILALVPESRVDGLLTGIEEITGNLDQVEGAVVYVQDLRRVRGTMKMLE